MGHQALASRILWKKQRDELSDKRNSLFKRYSRNPQDLELALEIKKIDDQIAEFTDKIRRETMSERKSKSLPSAPEKN